MSKMLKNKLALTTDGPAWAIQVYVHTIKSKVINFIHLAQ